MEDLLQAKTPRTAAILLDQWRGALADELRQIESHRSGGRMEEAHRAAQVLLERSRVGLHLIHPWTVVLCGPPNVGKSSLLNRILGYSRAIVHADAGTTRDLLAEETSIDGWPVMLIDSAGVRASADDIESQGIAKANRAIQSGDRLLLLVDPAQGWTNEHASIWSTHQDRCLVVLTKRDLAGEHAVSMPPSIAPRSVSALSGDGIDTLLNELSRSLVPNPPGSGVAVPFRSRHLQQLEEGLR
jgi:tRNA modification GTPase